MKRRRKLTVLAATADGLILKIGRSKRQVFFSGSPRFEHASPEQLRDVELVNGERVHWPALEIELPLTHLAYVVSARKLWAMKRAQQKRDHEAAARGEGSPESWFLIPPSRMHEFTVISPEPDDDALDD